MASTHTHTHAHTQLSWCAFGVAGDVLWRSYRCLQRKSFSCSVISDRGSRWLSCLSCSTSASVRAMSRAMRLLWTTHMRIKTLSKLLFQSKSCTFTLHFRVTSRSFYPNQLTINKSVSEEGKTTIYCCWHMFIEPSAKH